VSPRAVLVGLPGAGKSTTGHRLAKRLGVAFADSDDLVESRVGQTVSEIFATAGEAAFRDAEQRAIAAALVGFDGVLALGGGGAILADSTRGALAESGVPVVLLSADVATLAERLGPADDRPLLAGDVSARLAELAASRESLYREVATLVIDTDRLSPSEIAVAIERRLAAVLR
jgi:shikimate kinase